MIADGFSWMNKVTSVHDVWCKVFEKSPREDTTLPELKLSFV